MAGPTADGLWRARVTRAAEPLGVPLGPERGRQYRELMHEIGRERQTTPAYGCGDRPWEPTPRIVEIWTEIGALLGIGPPPWT